MSLRLRGKTNRFKGPRWAFLLSLLIFPGVLRGEPSGEDLAKLVPTEIGGYHQTQAFKPPPALVKDGLLRPEYFPPSSDPRQVQVAPGVSGRRTYERTERGRKAPPSVRAGFDD